MRIGVSRAKFSPIGLDVGDAAVKAVQLVGTGERWVAHRAARFAVPTAVDASGGEGAEVTESPLCERQVRAIVRVLDRMGFVGRRYAMTLPHADMIQTLVTLPGGADEGTLRRMAAAELARVVRVQASELHAVVWPLGEGGGGGGGKRGERQVLAAACRVSEAEGAVGVFDRAGCELLAIDAPSAAIARAVHAVRPASAVAVDLGSTATRVITLDGDSPAYQRTLSELSIGALHRRASETLGVSGGALDAALSARGAERTGCAVCRAAVQLGEEFVGRLLEEVRTSLHYAAETLGGRSSSSVSLCGGGAGLERLTGMLGERLGLEVSALAEPVAEPFGGEPAVLAQALGLALRFDTAGEPGGDV